MEERDPNQTIIQTPEGHDGKDKIARARKRNKMEEEGKQKKGTTHHQ